MKFYQQLFPVIFLFVTILSCSKNDDVNLIGPEYKNIELNGGTELRIPVLSDNWFIESVKDLNTGENISDKDQNSITLIGIGEVEAGEGWLKITKSQDDAFTMIIEEAFFVDRYFSICINNSGRRDYVNVIQKKGKDYKLVKTQFNEKEDLRKIYISDDDCISVILTNSSSEEVWESSLHIFKDVVNYSEFASENYGAFGWMENNEIEIAVPELIIDDASWWSNTCIYKQGVITEPYIKDFSSNKILLPPNSTTNLRGEITYCERVCDYTFTIENTTTGKQFDITGTWKQIVPISKHFITFD